MAEFDPLIIFVCEYSGSGKTTVIENFIRDFNYKIGTIKLIHHSGINLEPIGKDSSRHRQAGSLFSFSVSPSETALIIPKTERENVLSLLKFLQVLPKVDIIICEGYVELVFINIGTEKICRPPAFFLNAIQKFIK